MKLPVAIALSLLVAACGVDEIPNKKGGNNPTFGDTRPVPGDFDVGVGWIVKMSAVFTFLVPAESHFDEFVPIVVEG